MTPRLSLWGPVVLYMLAIFIVSSDSSPPASTLITNDKAQHLVAYAGLAMLVCRAVAGGFGGPVSRRAALATLLITVAYGISDELHQMFVPNRVPEWRDVVADFAGATLGLIACWAWAIIQLPNANSRRPTPRGHR